jgi:PAS domain S-box-containing protein
MESKKPIKKNPGRAIPVDGIVLLLICSGAVFAAVYFQLYEYVFRFTDETALPFVYEILSAAIIFSLGFGTFGLRRWLQIRRVFKLRRKTERALRASEERFKSLVNSLDDIVFTLDRRGRYTAVYGKWVHIYEKSDPDSYIGKTTSDLFGSDISEVHDAANKRVLAGESAAYEWSLPVNKDVRYFSIKVSPLRNERGAITGIVGVGHDITEKKDVTEKLHRHERELQALLENSPDIVVRYDSMSRPVYINRAFENVLGCNRNDLLGKNHDELSIPVELKPFWLDSIATVFHDGEEVTVDSNLTTPAGSAYFEARLVPEINTAGAVEHVLVVARDLTKYKRAEENLRRNEDQLERIIQTTPSGVTIIDLNGRIFFANKTAERMLGLTNKKSKNRYYNEAGIKLTTVDGKPLPEHDLPYIRVMISGEPVYGIEHAIELPDGSRRILSVNAAPLLDYGEKITGIITAISDITNLKQVEEAARKNEQRFRELANSISDVFFAVDMDMHCTYWNRASEQLTGISAKKAISQNISALFPESAVAELGVLFTESIESQATKTHVAKMKFQGKVYYFDINIYPARHGLSVFFKDVSERTYAERERERLIAELQDALGKVKTLSGLLPICAFCKKIRDDGGYWHQVETYIREYSEANFSHGICPECAHEHYPQYYKSKDHTHDHKHEEQEKQ